MGNYTPEQVAQRVNAIQDALSAGRMTAPMVFTKMREIIATTLRQQAGRVDEVTDEIVEHVQYSLDNHEDNRSYAEQVSARSVREALEAVWPTTAALAQNTQGEAKCRGPGWCEACSRAAGCCFQGERCDRRACPCPKLPGAELRPCTHAERARVPTNFGERIKLAIEHGDAHGWQTARNELLGVLGSDYFAAPSQRAEVKP